MANSTEWQRARLVVAFNEQPEEDKPPPWFIPTPPDRTKVRLERYKYEHHYAREPGMFDGIPLPATLEEAEALFGVLGIFGSYVNWQRAAIVHAVAAPHRMPDRVSFANMAAWDIIAAPNSGHIAALWDAWHKAVMAGKAEPTELGGPFVLPDMPWPHKPKRPPKKALTVAQKRAKRDWEFQQYYEKKHPPPEPHTEPGSFTPQPPVVYPMCSGCYRSDGTHTRTCWRYWEPS